LADRLKWTLDYVDALPIGDAFMLIDTLQNADLAHAHEQRKAERHAAAQARARGRRR